jgi:hypothetical protein
VERPTSIVALWSAAAFFIPAPPTFAKPNDRRKCGDLMDTVRTSRTKDVMESASGAANIVALSDDQELSFFDAAMAAVADAFISSRYR